MNENPPLEINDVEIALPEIEEAFADIHEPSSKTVHSNQIQYEGEAVFKTSVVKTFLVMSRMNELLQIDKNEFVGTVSYLVKKNWKVPL